ncbi:hypothetical protein B296_00057328 [Ensete ventricosum]|uniref:Uncharacterized protein n=1 Tax=Ensete ventricosum TaxID=4639 RepID=A0A426WXU6_ENSVE|nr:hypothetical protein B296_00057328 [Ensete ventricosum]
MGYTLGAWKVAVTSAIGNFKHGRLTIASVIDDFRHGRAMASSPLGAGRPLGSRPPAPISRDPRPWCSLFKAPIGSPDLRLDFFAPEVQADQKIAMYETANSDELIET